MCAPGPGQPAGSGYPERSGSPGGTKSSWSCSLTNHGQLIYVPRAHSCLAHRRPGEPSSWELRRTQAQVHAGNPVQMSEMCCVCLAAQLCLTLWDPMDCSLPGSSFHGILQTRILEWVAFPFSRRSSKRRDRTWVSCIAGGVFTS